MSRVNFCSAHKWGCLGLTKQFLRFLGRRFTQLMYSHKSHRLKKTAAAPQEVTMLKRHQLSWKKKTQMKNTTSIKQMATSLLHLRREECTRRSSPETADPGCHQVLLRWPVEAVVQAGRIWSLCIQLKGFPQGPHVLTNRHSLSQEFCDIACRINLNKNHLANCSTSIANQWHAVIWVTTKKGSTCSPPP